MLLIMQIDHPREIWGPRCRPAQFSEKSLPRSFFHAKGQCCDLMDLLNCNNPRCQVLAEAQLHLFLPDVLEETGCTCHVLQVSSTPGPTSTFHISGCLTHYLCCRACCETFRGRVAQASPAPACLSTRTRGHGRPCLLPVPEGITSALSW